LKDAEISTLYKKYLEDCKTQLKKLECCQEGWEKLAITGLNGWVFENLVAFLIKQELVSVIIEPQKSLHKRAKVDLLVNGKIAIEVKVAGVYGLDYIQRLKTYRTIAERKGWVYLYISRQESYEPYYEQTRKVLGFENAFFLDRQNGDWNRFIKRISDQL